MNSVLILRIILEKPVSGVLYGVQKGKGNNYETVQKQLSTPSDLVFEIKVDIKPGKANQTGFSFIGPFAQGPAHDRFIYIDIGTYAGQKDTRWSRRLKIPLKGISGDLIGEMSPEQFLIAKVPGTGKDGGPNCATVKPFDGWKMSN
jgi:hypothetical protein